MRKHKSIIFLAAIAASCFIIASLMSCSTESSPLEIKDGDIQTEGVVSDDPPGADDWSTDDTSIDENIMAESYPGCSNEIQRWAEPDPLTHPCNFQLIDQNGDYVELYDFEGDVILLDFSTVWCSVCKRVAEHVQTLHDQYTPFSAITVLTQDSAQNPPTLEVLQEWADMYGITTAPVLAGSDAMTGTAIDEWDVTAFPTFFLIDKDFYLRILQPGWNEETINGHIEDLIVE